MKKIFFLLLTVLLAATSQSQNVTVSGALVGNGSYPDMGAAFTAINGGAQTGAAISISVVGNTTETVSAVLNAGAWTSVTISPSGAAARTISGAITGVLIDLNGADNVTIDGLNTGGNSLTLTNTAIAASNTLRFINDASNNTVQNCTIQGSASTASNAVVFFSTGTTTGNDGNNINTCDITGAGANLPINGVFSLGTSAAIDNSGNTLNANNIFDIFSATAVYSGISLTTGNSTWTITNNRVYQTAARTITTANTENGINITSGGGYNISNNVIGYASASATGTMTLNSTVALRYIGINGTFTAGAAVSSIQNNTIAAITMTTSSGATTVNGILCGINVTSGNANIGTVTGNTIGASSGTGSLTATATTSGGLLVGINSSSTGTISIQNNILGSFACSGTTAAVAGSITGINVSGVAASMTISGNTIGNTTADNMRGGTLGLTTGSSLVTGINLPSTSPTSVVTNNIIRNLSSFGTGTTGFVRGIQTTTSGTTVSYNISNNNVSNLTSDNTNVGFGNGQLAAVGIYFASGLNATISENTISNISLTNTTTTGTNAAGISVAAALGTTVSRNKIFDISNASTSVSVTLPGTASGIFVRGHTNGTPLSFINNMISLGDGETTNTCFFGIWSANSNGPVFNQNVYFNSVSISGTAASGAQPSFCFLRGDLSATTRLQVVDVRNNIFSNTRSGGTGVHYAIANNFGATVSTTGWGANASNYNVLNANAANIGWWTTAQTFAGWQAASASDANSISGATVNFVDIATADLHITTPFPSVVDGAGIDIPSVTTDFDGQTRATLTPVDIGADAGVFSNSPAIALTPLPNICVTGARTLSTNITDPDGVPTSGIGLPVLYWRINAGAYTAVTATFVSGSQYDFTFGAGTAIGDVVSYYIAAQDNLANVGTSPAFGASGFTANPPAASTPPSAPYTYNVNPTLSGTYTVGVGGNYTTITAAAAAYSNNCLGGPVIFSLIDATYPSETFPINFNSNPDASAVNTLTIKPTGTTTISGSTASTIIQINGGDYITIDGSAGSTVNSICPPVTATRDLTIQNTNTASFSAVVWLNSITIAPVNGVTNCTVKNCIVIGGSNVNTAAGIGIGALPLISSGIDNDFNRVENNDIRLCRFGIYVVGQSAANKNQGNVISQNILTAASPNNIGEGGIFSAFENDLTVSGNQIDNIARTGSPDSYGINLGFGVTGGIGTGSAAIADVIGNATVTFNKIGIITNSGTFAAAGIALGNTVSGTQLIANNTVSGVAANGTATDFSVGIWLEGGTGTTNVFHNTVSMQGTQPGASSGSQSSIAFGVRTLANPLTVNNNIFSNTQVGAAAGTTTRFAAVALGYASPYTGLASNYNDLYSAGAGPGTYHLGLTGGVGSAGTSRPTLAAWQTETGGDALSKNVLPVFVSATDLHLVAGPIGTNWCLNSSGINIPAVTNDIDCQTRTNPPDIGADEFDPAGDATATPSSQTICSGATITTIVLAGTATSFNWTRDNNAAVTGIAASGSGNIAGALTNTTNAPVTVTFTIIPVDAGGCFGPSFTATVLVNPTPDAVATPSSQTICSGATITTIALTGNVSGTVFNWTRDNTVAVTGIAAAGAGDIVGALTNTTNAPVTVTFTITPTANSCPGAAITATVLVNPTPDAVATPSSQAVCSGTAITTIALTGSVGGTIFNWTRDNLGVTGIAAAGAGDINGTLVNATASPITVTFTITPDAGGCLGTPITATVTVNPIAVINSTQVEPTTCVSTDGSIDITVSGAAGPYTYLWTGPGVIPGNEDQVNLTVGSYSVTVTVTATGCQTTANFALAGPGGCSLCPTIGSFTSSPAGGTCAGQTVTLTASGLTDMGTTYGITFKYSALALPDPYVGGTVIATVPNGGLTGGGTIATTTTTFVAGNYFIYAILSPTPIDIGCRPAALVNLVVNPVPTVDPVANQVVCNNTATAAVNFTGSIPGTDYNWTNNAPSIGLAASGTGNIASFTATNATAAPVVATIVVTPSITTMVLLTESFNYTGAMQTFTVPAGVTSINIETNGAGGGTGATGGAGATGGVGGLGSRATGTLAVTPGQVLNIFVGGAGGTPTSGFNGGGTGGNANSGGGGGASDVRFPGTTAADRIIVGGGGGGGGRAGCEPNTVNGGIGGNGDGNGGDGVTSPSGGGGFGAIGAAFGAQGIGCGGFLGAPGAPGTALGIGGDGGAGQACCCFGAVSIPGGGGGGGGFIGGGGGGGGSAGTVACSGNDKGGGGGGAGGLSYTGGVTAGTTTAGVQSGDGLVTISYNIAVTCSGTPTNFTITVNPTPTVNAVANQTVCHNTATAAVNFTGSVPGTVYNWTNNTTSIGLAASGTGNIASFTATNVTNAPVTATITVTPSYTNAGVTCTGTAITFTITVNPIPTVNAVTNQTVCAGATATQVFSGAVAGTVFNWTNSNTAIGLGASGSGNISFTATNAGAAPIVGTITVTPTYTNGGTTCTGTPISFTITVNPNPTVNPVPNQVVCTGSPTAPVNFTGSVPGTVFTWTNNTPAIGLAASGTGNIASFIATNPGVTPLVATITVTPATGVTTPVTTTFNYTGAVQTFVVPAGITSLNLKAWGAQGNSNALSTTVGGLGGYAEGTLAVTPGQTIFINTGGGAVTSITGGFNGGGNAGANAGCATAQGGGGGGASDIRITANTLANRVLVAGGGGGAGGNRVAGCGRGAGGGGGGGLYGGGGGAGWPGVPGGQGPVPTGGTQAAGGAGGVTTFTPGPTNGFPGVLGIGGAGGTEIGSAQGGSATSEPGGIGGGLIGGSGLYNQANNWCGQSGAGGSSYIGGVTAGITTSGLRTGAGMVTITYQPPSATTCTGTPITFTITVNPNPSLVIVADPGSTICQGDPTLLTVRVGTSSPVGILYNQAGVAGNGSPSQVFEPANAAFTSQSADDFVVPAGTTWTITRVTADGIGAGVPTSINVFFYNNSAANLPGTVVASYNNILTFTQAGGNYNVTLPSSLVLGAGQYWVSIQVNMSFATSGQWFWGNFGTTNILNQYAWQNPGGGFGTPCTSWGYGATGCAVGGGVNRNNIFSIVGSSLADGGPLPPGYTFLWSPAAGLSSTTTNPVAAAPMVTTTYTVNVNTAQGCTNQASILITVNQRPTVTVHPVSRTNCAGTTATFTVAGTGTALTYQWQVSTTGCGGPWTNLTNTAPYSGVNTATLTINPVTALMTGYGYRVVLSGVCAPINNANISNCAVLTANPLPTVTVTPTSGCGGVAGLFGTLLTATGANSYTWAPLAGLYTNAIATIPYTGGNSATVYAAPTVFTAYTVTGTLSGTGCLNTATALIQYTPPPPTVTPSSVTMCLGDAAVRLVSGSTVPGSCTTSSGTISIPVPDNTANGAQATLAVSCVPAGATVTGVSVTFSMPTHTYVGDMIFNLRAPNGAILNLDKYMSGTATQAGPYPNSGFVNATISSTGVTALGTATTTPITGTWRADMINGVIPFVVQDPAGFVSTATNWNALYSVPNGTWTLAMADGGPADLGTLTSWSITINYVIGVPATPATWSPIAGLFNDAAATIPYAGTPRDTVWTRPTPAGVYNYEARVSSLSVPPTTIATNHAAGNGNFTITFNFRNNNPFAVNITGISALAFAAGASNVQVWYNATNINGSPGPITNANGWFQFGTAAITAIGGTTVQPFVTGLSFPIPANTTYRILVSCATAANGFNMGYSTLTPGTYTFSGGGCDIITGTNIGYGGVAIPGTPTFNDRGFIGNVAFGASGTVCTSPPRTVIVTVNQPTTITTQPVSRTICTDKVATFTVAAAGTGPFSYQWQVSTNGGNTYTNIANGGVYSGATTATLTITAPPVSMSGYYYRVVITGAAPCAAANSFHAILTVNPLPVIVISASPYTSLFPGLVTTLSSTVSPFAAAQYTWLRNGVAVAGANAATLVVNVDGLGDYQLRVTDVNGCTNISNRITIKDSISGSCFIYPNPNNGQFQVRYYSAANNVLPRSLTIYDAKGDRVLTQFYTIGGPYNRMDVDMRKYGKGLYWVEVGDMNGNRLTMCRVVIQ